jgi:O-antigen ligase/Tfp pilus assembly protein PilF
MPWDCAAPPEFAPLVRGRPEGRRRGTVTSWLDMALLGAVDSALAGVVFLVPALLGGRIALGDLVLMGLAAGAAATWCLRQALRRQAGWHVCGIEGLLLAAVGVVGLQLVRFPPAVLRFLSPLVAESLPLWCTGGTNTGALGTWSTLSLDPVATREGLLLLVAFALLIVTAVQRIRTLDDIERVLGWIAVATVSMAAVALVQYLTRSEKFLGFYEYPYSLACRNLQGTFTNRNHFAQFIALGLGPLAYCSLSAIDPRRSQPRAARDRFRGGLWLVALGFSAFVGLLSLSRGGTVAMLVATLVGLAVLGRRAGTRRLWVWRLGAAAMLVVACLGIHGSNALSERLDTFQSLETLDQRQGRRLLWKANLAAMAQSLWLGTGLGSHREVCPMYVDAALLNHGIEYTHAESGYFQVASEGGLAGLLVVVAALGLCGAWCVVAYRRARSDRSRLCLAAIAPGLAANAAHAAVDFVWFVPGCMVVVAVLAACAARLRTLAGEGGSPRPERTVPTAVWLAAAGCLVVAGAAMVRDRYTAVRAEPYWHRSVALQRTAERQQGPQRRETLEDLARNLEAVIEHRPEFARAHARLAAVHLQLFDHTDDPSFRPISVHDVCQAAEASRFASSGDLHAWLARAFPDRQHHLWAAWCHARQAIGLCPLEGEAYVCLAALAFLEGPRSPGADAYLDQAVRVRPHDGDVLLAAGQHAVVRGQFDKAIEHFEAAFHTGPKAQRKVIDLVAGRLPVAFVLDHFQPDREGLERMLSCYRSQRFDEDARIVALRYAEAACGAARTAAGSAAAKLWLAAAEAFGEAGDAARRLECLRQAVGAAPGCYEARYALAACLHEARDFEAAHEHLLWCVRRAPEDRKLRAMIEANTDGRLRGPTSAWRPSECTIPR